MKETPVTFTVLEDGSNLAGVYVTLHGRVLAQMGVDKGDRSLNWNIINDYRSGLISEDRE